MSIPITENTTGLQAILDAALALPDAGSGGAELNFEVVGGTTQPSNPSENTIWVNTDVDITGWYFSSKNPFVGKIANNGTTLGRVYVKGDTNRTLMKTGSGAAAWASYQTDNFYGLVLVSKSASACTFSCIPTDASNFTTETKTANGSFVYEGETYYYAHQTYSKTNLNSWTLINSVSYDSGVEVAKALVHIYNGEGKVWVRSGEISKVSFNTLKKNNVTVYPLFSRQFCDGEWVNKTTQSYQNSDWIEWTPEGALYWHGDECEITTGGWDCKAWKMQSDASTTAQTFEITRNTDNLTFTKTGGIGAVMYAPYSIDLTNVKAIHFKGEMPKASKNHWVTFNVWTSLTGTYWASNRAAVVNTTTSESVREFTLDVSALTGNHFIGFGLYPESSLIVEELYLEVE